MPTPYLKAIGVKVPSNHLHGYDGISLQLCESHVAAPNLWSSRLESHEQDSMDVQQRSSISFLYGSDQKYLQWVSERLIPVLYTTHLLELPLANTMFHNGQTSTMSAQRWIVMENGVHARFDRIKQTPLTQQTLDLTKSLGESELNVRLPLSPITVPRRVTAAMGNIIRRIQIGDTPEDDTPASKELEKGISSYFKRVNPVKDRVGVWALVTPRDIWVDHPQTTRGKPLFSQIENGARLHKVLSGGGGWEGAKEGLLSLDPHSTYNRSEQASQLLIPDDGDLEAEKLAVLGHIVKPGDVVQFFIDRPIENLKSKLYWQDFLKPKESANSEDPQLHQTLFNPVHGPRTSIFGTIPSTMDAMPVRPSSKPPNPTTTTEGKPDVPPHMIAHTHFGALSQQGISLTIKTHSTHDAADTAAPIGARRLGTVVQTKLDVPYARIGWEPSPAMFQLQLRHIYEKVREQENKMQARIRLIALNEPEAGDKRGRGRVQYWRVPPLPERKVGDEEGRGGRLAFERVAGVRPVERGGEARDGSANAGVSVSGGPVQGRSPRDGVDALSDNGPEAGAVERDPSGRDGSESASDSEVLLFDEQGQEFRFRRHDLELLKQPADAPYPAPMDGPVPAPAPAVEESVPTAAPASPVLVRTHLSVGKKAIFRVVSVDDKPSVVQDLRMRNALWRNAQRRQARREEARVGWGNAEAEEEDGIDRSSRNPTVDDSRSSGGEAVTDADSEANVLSGRPSPPDVETAGTLPPVPVRRETDLVMFRSLGRASADEPTAVNDDDDSRLADDDVDADGEGSSGAEEGVQFATQAGYQSLFSRVPHELFNPYAAQRERHRLSERVVGGGGEGMGGGLENRDGEGEGEAKGEGEGEGLVQGEGEGEGEGKGEGEGEGEREGEGNGEGGKDEVPGLKIIKVKNHIKKGLGGKNSK